MAYVVTEPCIGNKCRTCREVCPADAFYDNNDKALNDKVGRPPAKEGDYGMLFINPNDCLHCGACESECPNEAIFDDGSVPAEFAEYKELAAKIVADTPPGELEKKRATK